MKSPDSRSVSLAVLHDRRITALRLRRGGMSFTDIGKQLSTNRNTVSTWCRTFAKKRSTAALKPKPTGRPKGSGCHLTPEQEKQIRRALVDHLPDQLRMDFALWTRQAVRQLIADFFHIDMPIRTVGEYLKRWGFTPQRPVKRAYQRSEKAVRQWLQKEYPKISQLAKQENAQIHWADETGLATDDVSGRGYAPKGKTPVRYHDGRTHQRINLLSSITNQGKVRFMLYEKGLNADLFIEFLRRLTRQAKGKIFLIVDNLRVHHAKKVKEWVEANSEKISLFYLPSYSPDLNPDEYLNCDLKAAIGAMPGARTKESLTKNTRSHLRLLQRTPSRVASYFKAKPIQYAAA